MYVICNFKIKRIKISSFFFIQKDPFRSCDQNNGFSIMKSSSHPPASDVAEEIFITPPSLEFQHQMFWQSYANRFKEKRGGSYLPCYTHSHRIIDEWRI